MLEPVQPASACEVKPEMVNQVIQEKSESANPVFCRLLISVFGFRLAWGSWNLTLLALSVGRPEISLEVAFEAARVRIASPLDDKRLQC